MIIKWNSYGNNALNALVAHICPVYFIFFRQRCAVFIAPHLEGVMKKKKIYKLNKVAKMKLGEMIW